MPVLKMTNPSEIVFDHLMKSKMGYVAGAVIRPVGIDVTVDKDGRCSGVGTSCAAM